MRELAMARSEARRPFCLYRNGARPNLASGLRLYLLMGALAGLAACTSQKSAPEPKDSGASPSSPSEKTETVAEEALIKRGRSIYMANCIACHNPDPKVDGSVGPKLRGSSLELLEARVLRAEYPPGYKPQKASRLMPAQPHLKADLPALHAYINAP